MSIVVFGSINMDLISRLPRLPAPGETLRGSDFFTAPGGKGANQAVACARLGAPVCMVGRVGDDVFGSILRQGMQNYGVDITHVTTTPGASGVAVIHVDTRVENSIVIIPGANGKVCSEDLEQLEAVLSGADFLLLQLEIPLEIVTAAARLAHDHGIRIILDPAPVALLPDDLFTFTDFLTPNETECSGLVGFMVTDIKSAEKAAVVLVKRGVKHVIIKMGKHGAYHYDGKSGKLISAFHVEAVDTTPAGDAFNGALAVALSEGRTPLEAIRFANAVGAISTTRLGAQQSMPTKEEVEKYLRSQVSG